MATTIKNPSYRKRMGYHATLLGGMGLLASAALVLGDISTGYDIALRAKEDMQASITQVIPSSMFDNDIFEDTIDINTNDDASTERNVKVYRARMGKHVVAVAYEATATGYSGAIKIIIGINKDGEILGVRILSHSETPGLGDKLEVKKSNWITKFTGHSLANTPPEQWKVRKDNGSFDQFSGATITPRAVIKAIYNSLLFFARNKQTLFPEQKVYPADINASKKISLIKKYNEMSTADILNIINKI